MTTLKTSTHHPDSGTDAARQVLAMARLAAEHIERELPVINALNVFPVPDGDTGINMLATIREALVRAEGASGLRDTVAKLAQGAMLGARGNSGVILSQLFRAQEESLRTGADADALGPAELAAILKRASELAWKAVAQPAEGTMLSVLKATRAETLLEMVASAEAAVAATPEQLPILGEAGVVDSGGYGLLLVLRGWYEALAGEPAPELATAFLGLDRAREQAADGTAHPANLLPKPEHGYGHCVTILVDAPEAQEATVREQLQRLGESVLVAAVAGQLKLHVHVPDPELALSLARDLGSITATEISNIDEQTGATAAAPSLPIVAVVSGEGLTRLFRGLGARVAAGGPTQNPSTAELLAACDGLTAPVFLLSNNGNVLAAANQAAAARDGLFVVPTRSLPQGVAAALAYDAEAPDASNLERMARAAGSVSTAELVVAARDATIGGVQVAAGQSMVLFEGKLLGVEDAGLTALTDHLRAEDRELATIYYGAHASAAEAARLAARLQAEVPGLETEIVRGDQPHATFILGFE